MRTQYLAALTVFSTLLSACSGGEGGAAGTAGSAGSAGSGGTAGSSGSSGSAGTTGSSGSTGAGGAPGNPIGEKHAGQYNLGPVEWSEATWHNSCSPYPDKIQQVEGVMLAGVGLDYNGNGQLCDACIQIVTDKGKSVVARVVTTGETQQPGDIDVSPEAYDALNTGEYPRSMTWQVVACPDNGPLYYQFQTQANAWWTSLWVRNSRLPLQTLEVKSQNHADWAPLERGADGTWTDNSGFGDGAFSFRLTSQDGKVLADDLAGFTPGELVESKAQF